MEPPTEFRAAIICPDAALLNALREVMPDAGIAEAQVWYNYPAAAIVEKHLREGVQSICFLDVGTDHTSALKLLEQLAAGRGSGAARA